VSCSWFVFLVWAFLICNVLILFFQQAIAKAIEEKISGDQRRYLLNEQLKAIKKVLHYCSFFYQVDCFP
jgi:ATP-dependent Lon protease